MRGLAIARYRLLTTIRSAMPLFIIAAVFPLVAAVGLSFPPERDPRMLTMQAVVVLVAWLAHAVILVVACEAFGNVRSSAVTDLLDSAPLHAASRFFGEAGGVLGATAILHLCCLPLLTVCAALSPASMLVFAWIEFGVVALMVLASASAAWKRLAAPTKWSRTRTARSTLLFAILVLVSLMLTTRWEVFRDSAFAFFNGPSLRAWARVMTAVDNPLLLGLLLFVLYCTYLWFYFAQSTREPAGA